MLEVAAAVIERDGLLLLCQRPEGKRCALLWEFPGGKLEPGETPEVCLVRECREELDAAVRPKQRLAAVEREDTRIFFIRCALESDEPRLLEHRELRWMRPEEVSSLPLCPADKEFVEKCLLFLKL